MVTEGELIARRSAMESAYDPIRALSRIVSQRFDEALRPADITGSQFNVLLNIAVAGRTNAQRLAEWLFVEKSTVSRLLKGMEAKGWIKQTPSKTSRSVYLEVTDEGHDFIHDAIALIDEPCKDCDVLLGTKMLTQMTKAVAKLRKGKELSIS